LREEQASAELTAYRRLEAQLGFEPDDAPESLINQLRSLAINVGEGAISEVAPACSGDDPKASLREVLRMANMAGLDGQLDPPRSVTNFVRSNEFKEGMPWDRGRALAHAARRAWGVGDSRLPDENFSEILGIPENALASTNEVSEHLPLGLAVRAEQANKWKLMFRRKARTGRRFEAARLLCDYLAASVKDQWLPATNAKTVRQKIQRAFAAEFLCPIASLKYWLQDNYSPESIEEAGSYYGVSPLAIRSHLANHGLISATEVAI